MATTPLEIPTKKARSENYEETQNPGTSSTGVTYATGMAIVLEGYPEAKLSADQGAVIEDAIMEEILLVDDGSPLSFAGTCIEKGALIVSVANLATRHWLETLIPRLKPLGERKLIVGLRINILKLTRIFFRAHPKLLKKTPEKVLKMLDKQNPTFNVKEWSILPPIKDPRGYGFCCYLDKASFNAVRAAKFRANLGLWHAFINSSTAIKEIGQGPPDQYTTQ